MQHLKDLLRQVCATYRFAPIAIFQRRGTHPWPLTARNEEELERKLSEGGHFLPLPKEPAALANVIEVAVVDYIIEQLHGAQQVCTRGTERGYPDIEIETDGRHYAIDIKVAQRNVNKKGQPTGQTKSRITLYTGNTFFRYPQLRWPGTFRPFDDYAGHLDIIVLYTLDVNSATRVKDTELLVVEPWAIASKERSSTTREYLGAVLNIEDIRNERGAFNTQQEFYRYWRNYRFKIGDVVQKQLDRLLRERRDTNNAS